VGCLLSGACSAGAEASRDPSPKVARRIVSLVPAATEILFAIGAGDRVVGRTHWGTHPPAATRIADVGDEVRPALEAILALDPDLVILFAGSGTADAKARLGELGVFTLSLRHNTMADLARNVLLLGDAAGCPAGARALMTAIRADLASVAQATAGVTARRVYYDVWPDPPMTVGRGSFLDSLITLAGGDNVFGDLAAPAPQVGLEAIVQRDPEIIIVPVSEAAGSEALAPAERPGWLSVPAVSRGSVVGVDADLLGRLGPRLGDAAAELASALHPGLPLPARRDPFSPDRCGR